MAQGSPVKVDGGYLTIQTSAEIITVNHNLGVVPNFAAIWVDGTDYDVIPFNSCVEAMYQKNQYVSNGSYINTNLYLFTYQYKHKTSGNLLSGTYSLINDRLPTDTTFKFTRGMADWAALDTNGEPLRYRWVVGYIPITE